MPKLLTPSLLLAFLIITIVSILFGNFYQHLATSDLILNKESENAILTKNFKNSLTPEIQKTITDINLLTSNSVKLSSNLNNLNQLLFDLSKTHSNINITLLNLNGFAIAESNPNNDFLTESQKNDFKNLVLNGKKKSELVEFSNHSNEKFNYSSSRPTDPWDVGGNGAFSYGKKGLKAKDFTDGLSKTAFFSERTKGSGNNPQSDLPTKAEIISMPGRRSGPIPVDQIYQACLNYQPKVDSFNFAAAGRWPDGDDWSNGWPFAGYDSTEYNHVAEPNWGGYDCGGFSSIPDTPGEHAIVAARSEHPGVVVVVFGDGHTAIINDGIDLATWRALGTRNGEETIDGSF